MADTLTPEQRSRTMAAVKGKDTKPEERVRKYLFSHGYRYRKNDKRYPGKPDIVLPKYKTCIFVNGCFWHKHSGCTHFTWPKSNAEYWKNKIERNVQRDQKNYQDLEDLGWHVIIIWECETRKTFSDTMERVMNELGSNYVERFIQK